MAGVIDLTGDDDEGNRNEPINRSTDSEDDEELKLAIALSLSEQAAGSNGAKSSLEIREKKNEDELKPAASTTSLLGLDRKAMEAERLARLKRKRDTDVQPDPSSSLSAPSRPKTISPPPLRRQRISAPSPSPTNPSQPENKTPSQSSIPPSSTPSASPYLTPKVLLTSTNSGISNGISLPQILKPPSSNQILKSALLSSFIADFDWLLPHFNTRTTSFIFVLHAHSAQHRQLLQADFEGLKNVRLVMPECLGGGSNMHSKLMLLFFKPVKDDAGKGSGELCRLVIPSANLTPADWGVGGVMENVVFVVDLPVKKDLSKEDTRFAKELKKQLRAMKVPGDVLKKLDTFDFEATEGFGLVHSMSQSRTLQPSVEASSMKQKSIGNFFNEGKTNSTAVEAPASFNEDDPARTGLLSLSETISSLGLSMQPSDVAYPPKVDYITSSLGNLSANFIRQFYSAICGTLGPAAILESAIPKSLKSAIQTDDAQVDDAIKQNLRIYFPTEKTVRQSKGGPSNAGTICFSRKWWETNNLIRECLYDCVGVRKDGILMHSKILYVRFNQPKVVRAAIDGYEVYAGWAYVGSANFSESAWGRITTDTKLRHSKTTCRNWECGVVIPVAARGDVRAQHSDTIRGQTHLFTTGVEQTASRHNEDPRMRAQESRLSRMPSQKDPNALGEKGVSVVGNASVSARQDELQSNLQLGSDQKGMCSMNAMLLTLNEVFPAQVPLPIMHPTLKHVELQQHPWFFRD